VVSEVRTVVSADKSRMVILVSGWDAERVTSIPPNICKYTCWNELEVIYIISLFMKYM
jgi:hypothetical protein